MGNVGCQEAGSVNRHLERTPVTLSPCAALRVNSAQGLARRTKRSFAALRMTVRTSLKSFHPEPMRCAQGKLRAGPLTGSLLSKCLVCELVLTSFRNVGITLIHRDSASQIASIRCYFACYPQRTPVVFECDFERKAIFK